MTNPHESWLTEEKRREMRAVAEQVDAEKPEMARRASRALVRRLAEELATLVDQVERDEQPTDEQLKAARKLATDALSVSQREPAETQC